MSFYINVLTVYIIYICNNLLFFPFSQYYIFNYFNIYVLIFLLIYLFEQQSHIDWLPSTALWKIKKLARRMENVPRNTQRSFQTQLGKFVYHFGAYGTLAIAFFPKNTKDTLIAYELQAHSELAN